MGYKLPEFLKRQMEKIASWNKSVVESGLLLDLLAAHTKSGGRASECDVAAHTKSGARASECDVDLLKDYSHQGSILDGLIAQCKKAYLLVDPAANPGESGLRLRLAHDTLAPLVRELYETSVAPGQQARRILETRAKDWQDGKSGPPLAEVDLSVVEKGQSGMRVWTEDEKRLVGASQEQRRKRQRQRRWLLAAGVAAIVLIVTAGGVAERQRERAEDQVQKTQEQILKNYRQLAWSNWSSGTTARDVEQSPVKAALHLMARISVCQVGGGQRHGGASGGGWGLPAPPCPTAGRM